MKDEWFTLYEAMLGEMESCQQFGPDAMAEIECCFNLAQKYWTLIQNDLKEYDFFSNDDEIEFYKKIKPLFKSTIQFYNLLYQAEILKPSENKSELKEFWIKGKMKLDKFIHENAVFYTYYRSGETDRDYEYFLAVSQDNDFGKSIYMDDLIITLLALEKYTLYIQNELSKL